MGFNMEIISHDPPPQKPKIVQSASKNPAAARMVLGSGFGMQGFEARECVRAYC